MAEKLNLALAFVCGALLTIVIVLLFREPLQAQAQAKRKYGDIGWMSVTSEDVAKFLKEGWEPFAVTADAYNSGAKVYMRK